MIEIGFWLCANHDKLFEWGYIYFENDKLIISDKLNLEQKNFVKNITFDIPERTMKEKLQIYKKEKDNYMVAEKMDAYKLESEFYILPEHYNLNMHKYLEIHRNRVVK